MATTCMTPRVVRQKNMAMRPSGPRTRNDCAGEGQQHLPRPERPTATISLAAFTRFDDRNWNKDLITIPHPLDQVGACHVTRRRYQGSLNRGSIVDTIRIISLETLSENYRHHSRIPGRESYRVSPWYKSSPLLYFVPYQEDSYSRLGNFIYRCSRWGTELSSNTDFLH
jgi:hypothetical protein